jgi:hypothetical protein
MVSQWNDFDRYGTAFEYQSVLVSRTFTPSSTVDGLVLLANQGGGWHTSLYGAGLGCMGLD